MERKSNLQLLTKLGEIYLQIYTFFDFLSTIYNFLGQRNHLQSSFLKPLWSTIFNENKSQIYNLQFDLTPPSLRAVVTFSYALLEGKTGKYSDLVVPKNYKEETMHVHILPGVGSDNIFENISNENIFENPSSGNIFDNLFSEDISENIF